jgi:hypothetical protein
VPMTYLDSMLIVALLLLDARLVLNLQEHNTTHGG